MKYFTVLLVALSLLASCAQMPRDRTVLTNFEPCPGGFGCKSNHEKRTGAAKEHIRTASAQLDKGYLEPDEFDTITDEVVDSGWYIDDLILPDRFIVSNADYYNDALCRSFTKLIRELVVREKISYKRDIANALLKEKYNEVDILLTEWINWLNSLHEIKYRMVHPCVDHETYLWSLVDTKAEQLSNSRQKLTDPVLVKLTKALIAATDNENWSDAEKIQNIISSRLVDRTVAYSRQEKTDSMNNILTNNNTVILDGPEKKKMGLHDTARLLESTGKFGILKQSEANGLKVIDKIFGF
jgi:hypothetical protein